MARPNQIVNLKTNDEYTDYLNQTSLQSLNKAKTPFLSLS